MTCPKTITLNCLVVTAGIHQLTAAIWGNSYDWDGKAYWMRKQRNTHAVQFSVLACYPPAQHVTWSRLGVQSRWHGKLQWTSALNRWHQQDARKSSMSLWTREHNKKVSRDRYWGSCHHINSQHMSWQFSTSWITFRNEFCIYFSFIWSKPLRTNVPVLSESWIQVQIYSLRWSSQAIPLSFCSLLQMVCQYF